MLLCVLICCCGGIICIGNVVVCFDILPWLLRVLLFAVWIVLIFLLRLLMAFCVFSVCFVLYVCFYSCLFAV